MLDDPAGTNATGILGLAGGFAVADGPLPIGDIIGGGLLVGYGVYTTYTWLTKPKASLSSDIPKKLLEDKDHVNLGKFTEPVKKKKAFRDKDTGWSIEKDTAGHAGEEWKLRDKWGKRVKSLAPDGKIISK